jgi:23S rRNA (guanosine2251-2'-O)-methyltransferase
MVITGMAKRKPSSTRRGKGGFKPGFGGRPRDPADRPVWIYGLHATLAVAANPERRCRRLVATESNQEPLAAAAAAATAAGDVERPRVDYLERHDLEALLPSGAVHQGMAVLADPLAETPFETLLGDLADRARACVVVLDQATDPRNVGAVLRSAAAFGADAVVVQDRHAPPVTGALAKAASGALEIVPLIRVTNLARTLALAKDAGFWCAGLDGTATQTLADADLGGRIVLVFGAEGGGLRRLTRESCDLLVRIPIAETIESLNLSTAAAIALYELARRPQ